MKAANMFPSKYISAADLDGEDYTVTIANVSMEPIKSQDGSSEDKPVVYFREAKKQLILNVTNCNTLRILLASDETDDWVDQRITLYPAKVPFGNKIVDAVRIRETRPKGKAKGRGKSAPEPWDGDDREPGSDDE